jgi:nuclear mRNA export protein SAC3
MMDIAPPSSRGRGRGAGGHEVNGRGRQSKNKTWVSGGSRSGANAPNHGEGDRWERGGHHRSRGRGTGPRTFPNASLVITQPSAFENLVSGDEEEDEEEYQEEDMNEQEDALSEEIEEPELDTPEAREKFYQEVCGDILEETCNS